MKIALIQIIFLMTMVNLSFAASEEITLSDVASYVDLEDDSGPNYSPAWIYPEAVKCMMGVCFFQDVKINVSENCKNNIKSVKNDKDKTILVCDKFGDEKSRTKFADFKRTTDYEEGSPIKITFYEYLNNVELVKQGDKQYLLNIK